MFVLIHYLQEIVLETVRMERAHGWRAGLIPFAKDLSDTLLVSRDWCLGRLVGCSYARVVTAIQGKGASEKPSANWKLDRSRRVPIAKESVLDVTLAEQNKLTNQRISQQVIS